MRNCIITLLLLILSGTHTTFAAQTTHKPQRINKQCTMRYLCDETGKYCRWNKFCDESQPVAQTTTQSTKKKASKQSSVQQDADQTAKDVDSTLSALTPDETSLLQERIEKETQYEQNPTGIILYKPNYVLPYYYTGSPYQSIYVGQTPDNQKIMRSEFKAQLSLMTPLWRNVLGPTTSLNLGYTQLFYWQFYAESQYFRETNYEPEIFFTNNFTKNWLYNIGVVHESNGRGGALERSWNRVYVDVKFSGKRWLVSVKPWLLIVKNESSNLHNPDITHFLGHERVIVAYKVIGSTISIVANNLESGLKRGSVEADLSVPITKNLNAFLQVFSGYGQSLIEYDHRTKSIGIGVSLNTWA